MPDLDRDDRLSRTALLKQSWIFCFGASQISGRWRRGLLLFVPLLLFLSFFVSVSELHHKSALRERSWRRNGRPDHLVLGPAAGQGWQDRLQCRGMKALNKIHSSTPTQASVLAGNISFVTVFAIYNNHEPTEPIHTERVTVANVAYNKMERSLAILDTFFNFIMMSMPRSNIIILTDPSSTFPIKRSNVMLFPIPGDYSRESLMLQRVKSYIEFLHKRLEELSDSPDLVTHYIFTDSDIAVVNEIGRIFQDYPHFHLALTFRNNKEQPLNSGFIAVRGNYDGILKAKIFLQKVLDVYISKYAKASRMLGDQMALAWVVKSQPLFNEKKFRQAQVFLDEISGASVLFLPCALYNWTPPEGAGQFHGMPLDVKVVHFKGSRKRLMLESWNFLNSSWSNLPDMLCLILMSGRTKYDF